MRIVSGMLVGILVLGGGLAARAQDAPKPVVYNHLTEASAGMDALVHQTYDDTFRIVDFSDRDGIYVPPHILYGPKPPAPAAAGGPLAGTVVVFFIITADGRVTQPVVAASSEPRLDPGVLATLARWLFTPARLNGRPVAVTAGQEFSLP